MSGEPRFVFVIGAARSGTKFLRDLLGHTDGFSRVPYDVNYVWRRGNESVRHDALPASSIGTEARERIRRDLVRLARRHDGDATTVIEKTVANALRVPFVRTVFPDARFIYLERQGRHAVSSAYEQWTAPLDWRYLGGKIRFFPWTDWRYATWFAGDRISALGTKRPATWGPRYPGIQHDLATRGVAATCALQWKACVESARAAVGDDTFTVTFDQLDPSTGRLAALLEWLDVTRPGPVLAELERTYRPSEPWPGRIPADALAECASIVDSVGPLSRTGPPS